MHTCLVFLILTLISKTVANQLEERYAHDLDLLLEEARRSQLEEEEEEEDKKKEERELEERSLAMYENRHYPYGGGPTYGEMNDIYVDKRWRSYYADYPSSRDMRVMNGLTQDQIRSIVDLHNKLRRAEGGSNMEILRYNEKLARLAQGWSQRCVFEHGNPPYSESDIGYKYLGQNIYAHSDPKFTVEQAVQAWYDEKPDFDYNSLNCRPGRVCGHYTAVTWAKTTDVGCGLTFCPSMGILNNAHFIVCNYAPAGNFQGEKPFLKGPSCTQCDSGKFYCNDGLCDKSCNSEGSNCQCKASCKKCGKRTRDCRCECKAGTTGPDCSEQCADKDPKCGANPGYPQFLCTMADPNWAFVKDKCPKLCGKCSAGRSMTCRKRSSESVTALKRLMLGYLEDELEEK